MQANLPPAVPSEPTAAVLSPDSVPASAAGESSAGSGNESGNDPIAFVSGEPMVELPQDLYIPPDALEVFLDAFEGPLDLLLYLIKRQNLDILDIPIADITQQYMHYIGMMESMRFELAAEYLLMAAMLAEIKSRMLLPRVEDGNDDEDDPRAELIRRLQEYERIKDGAENLNSLPRMERELHPVSIAPTGLDRDIPLPDVSLKELLLALRDVAERARLAEHHNINRETLSVRARMTHVLSIVQIGEFCEFSTLFNPEEGRLGIVVTFLAVLELSKESLIDIVQSEPYAPIYLKSRSSAVHEGDHDEQLVASDDDAGDKEGEEDSVFSDVLADASEGTDGAAEMDLTAALELDEDAQPDPEPDDDSDRPVEGPVNHNDAKE